MSKLGTMGAVPNSGAVDYVNLILETVQAQPPAARPLANSMRSAAGMN
jgi:hypothetical protein